MIKYTLTIYLSILLILPAHASRIDSLLAAYETAATDSTKMKLLADLYNYYLYRDRPKAKQYAQEELDVAEKLNNLKGESQGHYHLGVIFNNAGQTDSAQHHYGLAFEIADSLHDVRLMSDINHAKAIQQFYMGNLDEAMEMTAATMELNKQANDSLGLAISLDFMGMIHQNKGNYNIALTYLHQGLDIFQEVNDSIRLADAYTHLAAIESNLKNRSKSIEYNKIALEIYRANGDTYYESQALNDIGQMYLQSNDLEQAKEYLEQSLQRSLECNARSITGTVYVNLGKLEIEDQHPQQALEYFYQALQIQEAARETRKQIITKNQMARAYNELGAPGEAIALLNEVVAVADSINSRSTMRYAYAYRSNSFKLLGEFESALLDFQKYKEWSDTLFNAERSRQIEELRTVHDLERKEADLALRKEEIKVLNGEVKLANIKKMSYASGMVVFIVIAGLTYYSFSQRMKKKEIERQKQEELLRTEIEFKKKQLVSQTLHLVQKSTFIQELKENLQKADKSPEKYKIEFRRIAMLLRKETALEKDWETFKSYFIDVHNNFEAKIKKIYSEVTEKELRLASFLKMNLSTKEIASILNVMPDSVLKSKYRLKKKLQLPKEADLYGFLKEL